LDTENQGEKYRPVIQMALDMHARSRMKTREEEREQNKAGKNTSREKEK